jgi:hypothetical protein
METKRVILLVVASCALLVGLLAVFGGPRGEDEGVNPSTLPEAPQGMLSDEAIGPEGGSPLPPELPDDDSDDNFSALFGDSGELELEPPSLPPGF